MTSAQHAEGRQFDPGQVYAHYDTLGPLVMIEALIVCSRFPPIATRYVVCAHYTSKAIELSTHGQDRTCDLQRVGLTS